jgi:ABC-type transport system involved in multi-copper enzyme maturation permease subunit
MSAATAAQMTGADFLKLRKKRGTVIWALALAVLPLLIFFIVRAAQHSSNALKYEPAGGLNGYVDGLRIIALFFGPLAAIMIGTDAGAADVTSGVFRDLVVTGRSRLALFATRVPAAIALTWLVMASAYLVLVIGTLVFASGAATPSASLFLNGVAFTAMTTGVICVVAVGFASLTGSRAAALTALIGWHLVASPILASIGSLGSSRELLLSQAMARFSPVHLGDRGASVSLSEGTALVVLLVWAALFFALGAWGRARWTPELHGGGGSTGLLLRPCGARVPRIHRPGGRSPGRGQGPRPA